MRSQCGPGTSSARADRSPTQHRSYAVDEARFFHTVKPAVFPNAGCLGQGPAPQPRGYATALMDRVTRHGLEFKRTACRRKETTLPLSANMRAPAPERCNALPCEYLCALQAGGVCDPDRLRLEQDRFVVLRTVQDMQNDDGIASHAIENEILSMETAAHPDGFVSRH